MRSASSAASSSASRRCDRGRYASSASPSSPSAGGVRREAAAQPVDDLGAVAHQRDAVAGELGVPGAAASRGRRGPPAPRRSARCAARAPREYSRRVAARAGHSAATTWSRCARRSAGAPEHELEPVGQEDGDERPRRESVSRSTGAPSARSRFGSPGWKPTADLVRGRARPRVSSSSRVSAAPKRTTSRSLRRPARAARCRRSTAPRAGSSCPRRCGRR